MAIPKIIAEIGNTHIGSVDRAKDLCKLAARAGSNFVKLQKRNPFESTPEHMKDKPHPCPYFAYGETYLEHRLKVELPIDAHAEIQQYCKSIDIQYVCSVWDMTSAKEIIKLNPPFIKIPSPCNTNIEMIEYVYKNYFGHVHLSTGMSFDQEIENIIEIAKKQDYRSVIYHCTSIYPCPFEKLYLKNILRLVDLCKGTRIGIGFSNHGYGIATDMMALAYGAEYFERHFIDDRCFRHTDASASLEFSGMEKLCRDLKNGYRALQERPDDMDELELEQRYKLKHIPRAEKILS